MRIQKNPVRHISAAGLTVSAVALCVLATSLFAGQTTNRGAISPEVRAQVRRALSAIGLISVRNTNDANPAPRPRGSSVVVRSDGVLVTNYHVVNNPRTSRPYDEIYLSLSSDGETAASPARYRLKLLVINKEYDLTLLRVVSDAAGTPIPKSFTFPSVEIGDSRKIKVLEDLFIIGFPEKGGTSLTVNRGVVEGKDILANWIKQTPELFTATAAEQP